MKRDVFLASSKLNSRPITVQDFDVYGKATEVAPKQHGRNVESEKTIENDKNKEFYVRFFPQQMIKMSQIGLSPLHQALRKAFQCVENNQKTWRTVLQECDPLVVSLGNLAQQFVALSKVDLSQTPLKDFPDLEEKLRFKLHHAADTVMGKLNEKLSSLQSVRDSVGSQVASVFQIHEQFPLDLWVLTERSPAAPSVADMMQWLQDADRHFRQQFMKRKTLLLTLRPDDFAQMESAPERWKSLNARNAEDKITDALCKVSFFAGSH